MSLGKAEGGLVTLRPSSEHGIFDMRVFPFPKLPSGSSRGV